MKRNTVAFILSSALFTIAIVGTTASAQEFPSRPIDLIVNFGPGGGADGMGRTVARLLSPIVNVPVPASNVAGAAGNTGLTKVAGSEADGYTIGTMTGLTVSSWASGMGSLTPDDFSYLAIVQSSPSMLYVPKDSQFKSYQDLLDYTKANPGEVRVATAGLGTLDDLTVKFLGTKGHEMKNVPYAKPAERYISPLGGHTEVLYEEPGDVVQFLESGQMRPLVVFSENRHARFPDVPTSFEFGHEISFPNWRGVVTASKVPADRTQKLNEAMAKVVAHPDWKEYCAVKFSCIEPSTPNEAHVFVKQQFDDLSKFMKQFGITK
ncbi:MAG: tripartite tricarboxylate transporter substrate binding protein [Gammaproteobacteria bacterium]|nr:tripartite tricarboxylate transporter substrate binding protein [Gammaproteobacteria bacterium]